MDKNRKTANILNVFQYDHTTGVVTLPSTLSIIAPAGGDNSATASTTAWVRTYISSLNLIGSGALSTTDVTEGTRLYYTDARVGSYLTANSYATQTYVGTQIANLVASSPATLDTLNELASALGNDPNFATTVATSIGTKQAQLNGTGFVKVTGTTVSYDNSIYQPLLTNPVTGTGTTGQVAYFNGTSSITSEANLFWDAANDRLGVGLVNPQRKLEIYSTTADSHLRLSGSAPSVSLGEAITGSIYQAKFGLATASGQYATGAAAGDFVIIAQTGSTIFSNGSSSLVKLTSGGNFEIGYSGTSQNSFKLDVNGTGRFTNYVRSGSYFQSNDGTRDFYFNPSADFGNGALPSIQVASNHALQFATNNTLRLSIASTGAATFSSSVTIGGDSTTTGVANFNNEVRAGAYSLSSLNYIDGTNVPLSTRRYRASGNRTNNDNGTVGLDLTNLQSTNGVYSPIISFSSTTSGGVYNCTYAGIWGVKIADEGSWASGDLIFGTANPYGVTQRLRITSTGSINADGTFITSAGFNTSKNIVAGEITPLHLSYTSSDGIGPAVRFGSGQGFWDIQPNNNNQRLSFEWSDSVNTLSLFSDGRVGINDTNASRRLAVNFGTSVNDGLIVYGSQRQNTVFRSTGEHCFLFMDSFHNNTFLPILHLQRSSTTFGTVQLQRASNSDAIGAYAESEMLVGSVASVPFSLQTNGVRRVVIQSSGSVNVYNTLTVSNNFVSRNFNKYIKTWNPSGSTGSYTTNTYNWADELASVAGSFDSAGYYKGFIRSANGAHYNGYQFDILVGQIGYGSNALQFKVQNITPAHSPWVGGCGPSPFGTVDNTIFEHRNNPCGEALELFITKLGG